MTNEEHFKKDYHLKRIERCCGTCRYCSKDDDDIYCCWHPEVRQPPDYGYFMDINYICDLWKPIEKNSEVVDENVDKQESYPQKIMRLLDKAYEVSKKSTLVFK